MTFYFQPQGNWAALNKEAALLFSPDNDKADVRVFAGAAHAMLEFTLGFREQFPLRKKFYYFKDLDPHFALAATALAKAGVQVSALSTGLNVDEFIATLDREYGFLFFPLDNPVTGEIYPFAGLEKALVEKGFPHLKVSYGLHRVAGMKQILDRNEAVIYNFPANEAGHKGLALLTLGDRMRFGSPVAAALSPVTGAELHAAKNGLKSETNEEAVKNFEAKRPGGAKAVFGEDKTSRLFDRAVLYFEDMDGHAFLDALGKELDQPLAAPGQDPRFETTSLSRWGGIRTMDWLKTHGFSPEQIRGLMTIGAKLLTPEFEKHFLNTRENVLQMQRGE